MTALALFAGACGQASQSTTTTGTGSQAAAAQVVAPQVAQVAEVPVEEAPAEPEEVLPEIEVSAEDIAEGEEILDTIEPIDDAEPVADERDGLERNSTGELVELDEAASLACANIEIALTALDEGDIAAAGDAVAAAATWSEDSTVAPMAAWLDVLRDARDGGNFDLETLVGFLSVCADGGYEL